MKMIATFVVALLVIGCAYCRSVQPQPISPEMNDESLNGRTVLIRNARQSGGTAK